MHHPTDRIVHTTAFVTQAGTKNSSMGPPHEGSIRRPITPWVNALTTELHLAPHSISRHELDKEVIVRHREHKNRQLFVQPGHENRSTFLTTLFYSRGARCSSVVRAFAHGTMGRWTYWAISRSSQCSTTDVTGCNPVCGIVHIKEPLLLIGKSSPCGSSGFPFSLSEWSFTICLTPYNRKIKCVECIIK